MPDSESPGPSYGDAALSPGGSAAPQGGGSEGSHTPERAEELPAEILTRTPFPRPRVGAIRNILATIIVGAVIVGLIVFFDRPGSGASETVTLTASASGPAPRIGREAPDFLVQGLDDESYRLSDFRGRPVWINFWATWCPPCRAETPDMQAVYEAYQEQGLVLIALSIGESASTVQGYVDRTGITYLIGLDQSTAIAATYRIVGIPTHFFVDRGGILRELRIGAMSKDTMEKKVEEIMSPSAAAEAE